ncbi:MAG TPA: dienelactone hydrolase family protein [Steroidobacteraceae bacterium]|nr:dienelactone hydrolase family protein [Steroidobacteraceae bacterium]HRX87869.1 dienelactone hydrolase family protein [Steroidobacteraceae bacterium]
MGDFMTLMARDGHEFSSYLSKPAGAAKGAVIVVQEIFGVNSHIRAVTDDFAAAGYLTIAPALFDRVRRGIELGYSTDEIQTGRGYMMQVKPAQFLADVSAALAVVKHAGRTGIVGYCWGGTVAYVAACEVPVSCAVCYYGRGIVDYLERKPRVPVMYHYGERDGSIPPDNIAQVQTAHPEGSFHLYPAGHGFNCTQRADYDAESATLARARALSFFAQHLDIGKQQP